jgi:hypothetical protein
MTQKIAVIQIKNKLSKLSLKTQTFWQFLSGGIQTDMLLLQGRKKSFSYFFPVLFTHKKSKDFNPIILAEKVCSAYSLKPYLLIFKTNTL